MIGPKIMPTSDGSAGDADYAVVGANYSSYRVPDPRIARVILDALGDAVSVLNVGAGAGGYEPGGSAVVLGMEFHRRRPGVRVHRSPRPRSGIGSLG